MKEKLLVGAASLLMTLPAFAGPDSTMMELPEPSTLGLFAAAAIAIAVMAKLKK